MARLARVVAVDIPHHVTQRANARRVILESDSDKLVYIDLLRQHCTLYELHLLLILVCQHHFCSEFLYFSMSRASVIALIGGTVSTLSLREQPFSQLLQIQAMHQRGHAVPGNLHADADHDEG